MSFFSKLFKRNKLQTQQPPSAPARPDGAPLIARGYNAAKESPFLMGWSGDLAVSANMIKAELPAVRARVRNLAFNEPLVVRALQLLRSNVVGSEGIKLTADVLSKNGEIDLDASDILERAWKLWAETPEYCDAEGRSTLTELLWRIMDSWMRDGEALLSLMPGADNPFGFSVKLLRPDSLAVHLVKQNADGKNAILNGVELDANGKPTAYHFYTEVSTSGTCHGRTQRIPAGLIVHLYTVEYPGQYRGFSAFAPSCTTMKHVNSYREAELIAARKEACRSGTWERDPGAIDPALVASGDNGALYQTIAPGETRIAPYGWHYQSDGTPMHPNGGYTGFQKNLLQTIASGLNLSYPCLASDLEGVSYSSIRQGVLEDREAYKCLQAMLVSKVLRPIFRRRGAWLDCWLLKGGSGFSAADADRLRFADTWLPRRWQWVDVAGEAQANETAVAHGWRTDSDIAAESGKDFYDNILTMKQERDWLRKAGLIEPVRDTDGKSKDSLFGGNDSESGGKEGNKEEDNDDNKK